MQLTIYQVDAFTNKLFQGNPAAIIPLEKWLDTELMQTIAMENNLSETAFFIPSSQPGIDYEHHQHHCPGRYILPPTAEHPRSCI